jgi:outer membrane lipoprotein-sorting protein
MRLSAPAAVLLLGLSSGAHAAAVDPLLARLDAQSKSVRALSGEFVQKNRIKIFKQEVRSKGKFLFERPRRIRWEYTEPDPSVLVLDGDTATLKTPGATPQTFDLKKDAVMRAVFDQLLLWLGSDTLAKAKGDYDLAAGGTDAAPTLALTPKPGGQNGSVVARAFARIELRFDQRLLLSSILLKESSGDEKEIVFTKMEMNPKLPEAAFKP